jgi:DNA-binding NarL/FixJ family response regulator
VPKNTRFDELKSALSCIDSGRIFVPEDMQFAVESARSLHDQNWETRNTDAKISILSARELEIVKLVAAGFNNAAIGEKLFLSPLTVKTHRANILRKLGLKNAIALVQYANAMNL